MDLLETYCQLSLAQQRIYEQFASHQGLSANSLAILRSLVNNPDSCTQTTIYEENSLPKQTVNSIIKDLVKKGWLELIPQTTDRRKKYLKLTEQGVEDILPVVTKVMAANRVAFEKISLEDQQVIVNNFALFNQALREELDI